MKNERFYFYLVLASVLFLLAFIDFIYIFSSKRNKIIKKDFNLDHTRKIRKDYLFAYHNDFDHKERLQLLKEWDQEVQNQFDLVSNIGQAKALLAVTSYDSIRLREKIEKKINELNLVGYHIELNLLNSKK